MPPSLVALCLRILARYPDQIHALTVRLRLRPSAAVALIDDLVPDPAAPDPLLWAVLTQLYAPLPKFLAACALPLYHTHLPLLQSIPPSNLFSLVTLLDLSATQHLTDQTIHQLKFLHLLTALDASTNPISSYGIKSLAATMQLNDGDDNPRRHRGPYELRILALKNCKAVDNTVYPELDKFPLLSVVDLRGTGCTRYVATKFKPCTVDELYAPYPLRISLAALQDMQPDLAASPQPYIITIDNLHPPETRPTEPGRVGQQDSFVVIPSNTANKIKVGNTHVVEIQREAREEEIKHERNKAAWYERQERIEENEHFEESPRLQNILRTPTNFSLAASTPLLDASTRLPLNPRSTLNSVHQTITADILLTSAVTPAAHIPTPTAILSTGASLGRSHLPQPHQNILGRTLPPRSNHSSVPAQRLPASAVNAPVRASLSAPQSSTAPNSAALRGGAPALGGLARTPSTLPVEPPHLTNVAVGHPGQTGASVASNAFYARPRLTAPTSTRLNASRSAKPGASDRQAARAAREAPQAYLKLLRPPPAYAALGLELDRQEKAKRQREDPALRGGTSALSGMAAVNIDGVKARRVREAIESALAERMTSAQGHAKGPPAFILDADTTQRKMPVFSFPASPATSSLATNSSGKMLSMSAALAAHSASFAPSSTGQTQMDSAPVARSRNPFRKRVISYPDMPAFGDAKTTDTTPPSVVTPLKTIKAPSDAIVATKAAAKPVTVPSAPIKREPSMEKAKAFTSKPNVSAKDICPRASTSTKPKPLIPISAVKVPILPEDVREEVLRRDAQELANMPRKRSGTENDEEDDGDDDSVDRQPPLKKRTIVKGRGSTSSVTSLKGKGKGKEEKTKAFDWKGWGKED